MMPTFEPVAFANVHNLFYGKDLELGDKLFTESQLQQAYEAGLRDAVPEGFTLVPTEILNRFREINPSNYDHDDACRLNAWGS